MDFNELSTSSDSSKLYIFDKPIPCEANSTHLIDILLSPLTDIISLKGSIFFFITIINTFVTNIISKSHNVDISQLNFDTENGTFSGEIKLNVKKASKLVTLIKKLEKINGIDKVVRD